MLDNLAVKEDDTLVDIACGNGRFLNMLAKKQRFTGIGVDISDEMVKQAGLLNPDMLFLAGSCDKLPFENGSISAMTVSSAYHHFPDVNAFAKEAERVMKQDGILYIAEVNLPSILRVLFNLFLRFSKDGDVRFYSSEEIISLFEQHGFVPEKTIKDGKVQLVVLRRVM